jgi:hypothetical protein
MAYVHVRFVDGMRSADGADVSHLAELVRGYLSSSTRRPPHPPFGHLLPKGRRATPARSEFQE